LTSARRQSAGNLEWDRAFPRAFADELAFAEVVAFGRAFRESDRPREEQNEP
jgi:hypothetical protein